MTPADLDALVARLKDDAVPSGGRWRLRQDAAAALVQLRERIAALEAERDALQKNSTVLVQMFELASSIPSMSDEQLRQLVANGRATLAALDEEQT